MEQRALALLEAKEEDGKLVIDSLAVPFNKPSVELRMQNGTYATETIRKGAFVNSLKTNASRIILSGPEHNFKKILGTGANGSLTTQVKEEGIWFRSILPDTQDGRDTYKMVKDNYLPYSSFTFDGVKDKFEMRSGKIHREIYDGTIHEFTFTAVPAYLDTKNYARSLDSFSTEMQDRVTKLKILQILTSKGVL